MRQRASSSWWRQMPHGAAVAAEARGLIAASSRILSALDHVPAGIVPKGWAAPVTRRLPPVDQGGRSRGAGSRRQCAGAAPHPGTGGGRPGITGGRCSRRGGDSISAAEHFRKRPRRLPGKPRRIQSFRRERHSATRWYRKPQSASLAECPPIRRRAPRCPGTGGRAGARSCRPLQAVVVPEAQAKGVAAADQAPRLQQSEQARQGAVTVIAQRTSVEMRRDHGGDGSGRRTGAQLCRADGDRRACSADPGPLL